MSKKILLTLAVFALFTSKVAVAGDNAVAKAIEASGAAVSGVVDSITGTTIINKIADPVVGVINSSTGGVTSTGGGVKADGMVLNDVINIADSDNAKATVNVGGNTKTTAKSDISAKGFVGGKVTNKASGKNSTATTLIGGNGQ